MTIVQLIVKIVLEEVHCRVTIQLEEGTLMKNLTKEKQENIMGHYEAARNLIPYKSVLEMIADMSHEIREQFYIGAREKTYEQFLASYDGNIPMDEAVFNFGMEFIQLFLIPQTPEVYLKLMDIIERQESQAV